MPSVAPKDRLRKLFPRSADVAAPRAGQPDGVALVGERRPKHQQLAPAVAQQERPVGDVQFFSGDVRADPWRLGRLEQRDRLSRRAAQVFFEPDGFDRAVADLRPLMAENHPWPSLSVHMQRSVERVPAFGRNAPFAVLPVRSSRRVGLEYGCAEQAVGLAAYRREQIVFVPIGMAFGRPEIVPAPEAFVRNESGVGARPLFQVAARIAVKPFGTVQNVGLVGPEQVIRAVACDGQDIRVADMNPGERHGPFRRLLGR